MRSFLRSLYRNTLGKWLGHEIRRVILEEPLLFKLIDLPHPDPKRLQIHPTAVVNNAFFNTSSGSVVIEEYAFFGHYVRVLAGTHDIDRFGLERQNTIPDSGHDIRICKGAWICTGATLIGPCVIGENSVVAAGAVVTRDVPSMTIVAGIPARPIRQISG